MNKFASQSKSTVARDESEKSILLSYLSMSWSKTLFSRATREAVDKRGSASQAKSAAARTPVPVKVLQATPEPAISNNKIIVKISLEIFQRLN
jgi:acetolactate synthase small subunit